jgi:DNA-binding NtrC family response regulator
VQESRLGIPVVLITAYGSESIAREAVEAGAFDYVPKPFNNDELRAVVRRAIESG